MVDEHQDQEVMQSFTENEPLLKRRAKLGWNLYRHYRVRYCVNSKAALAILMWTFTTSLMYTMIFNPDNYAQFEFHWSRGLLYVFIYGAVAAVYCLFPIAGHLADNYYSRFKVLKCSLYLLFPTPSLCVLIFGTLSLLIFNDYATLIPALVVPLLPLIILASLSLVGFNANAVQFGMDQLYDSPADDQSIFIHWYAWAQYGATLLTQFAWNLFLLSKNPLYSNENVRSEQYYGSGFALIIVIVVIFTVLLKYSVDIIRHKQNWFLVEPCRVNPYKLVYKVSQFAHRHKVPLRRSAFTFCEDDLPTGLDLGKKKYGGPFTTEEVEDVKVFYGIIRILFSLGPIFFLNIAADTALNQLSLYGGVVQNYNETQVRKHNMAEVLFIENDLISPLIGTISIPIYLFLLRPPCYNYIPGILKRIGIGILLLVISLMSTLVMDIIFIKDSMFDVFSEALPTMSNEASYKIPANLFLIQ